jgi:AraC-like DNA-binding protein
MISDFTRSRTLGWPPLGAFPQIRTKSIWELEASVAPLFGAVHFEIQRSPEKFNVVANHCQLRNLSLTYARHGAAVTITVPKFQLFAQLFAGRGRAKAKVGPKIMDIDSGKSFLGTPGTNITLMYEPDFEQLILRIDESALRQKLSILLDGRVIHDLHFECSADLGMPECQSLRRLLRILLEWVDDAPNCINSAELVELEQATIIAFLFANRHQLSDALHGKQLEASPWQVRRAEAYIEANWRRPLTVEVLARSSGTSVRSLFRSFQKSRACSPMEFLRNVRLQKAFELLSSQHSSMRVTDIALTCGFGNVGHFARFYHQKFGELPSATLGRAKGSP